MVWPKGKPRRKDLSGQRFTQLTVQSAAPDRGNKRAYWLCKCDCGSTSEVSSDDLQSGHIRSCGCLNQEVRQAKATQHGYARTPTYVCWSNMHTRCKSPKQKCYPNYGGRGISVCDRWNDFTNFLADMGEKPEGMTLDRVDVNGNYTPENCRWADIETQSNNRRTNVFVSLDGEALTLTQAAKRLGCTEGRIRWARKKCGEQWLDFVRAAAAMAGEGE